MRSSGKLAWIHSIGSELLPEYKITFLSPFSGRLQLGRLRTVRYWMLAGGKRTFGYRP